MICLNVDTVTDDEIEKAMSTIYYPYVCAVNINIGLGMVIVYKMCIN